MLTSFIAYIRHERLFSSEQRILLAVSGGVDSAVMCALFKQAGLSFAVAHCNFQLRGKESEEDEAFVEDLAVKYGAVFHVTAFDTAAYAKKQKLSVQAAARELRYTWFGELRDHYGYDAIATAHHQDDSIETFFINLLRGTGISGLHGILPRQGHIVRPLLCTGKQEILAFAKKHRLEFREDSSNASDKYVRNKIRLKLIPLLQQLNPDIRHTLQENMNRIAMAESIYRKEIRKKEKELLRKKNGNVIIPIGSLRALEPLQAYLFEFLRPYGFKASAIKDIIRSLDTHSGKQFLSDHFLLIRDREELIIQERTTAPLREKKDTSLILIPERTGELSLPDLKLTFKRKRRSKTFRIPASENAAAIDLEKLEFPLELRKWRTGDSFYPLGMNGKKKLSDFFIDQKFSLAKKERTWLLLSKGSIVWVIGERMDDRFKISPATREIYFVRVY